MEREKQEQAQREEAARLQKLEEERLIREQEELEQKRAEELRRKAQEEEEEKKRQLQEISRKMQQEREAPENQELASEAGASDGLDRAVVNADALNGFSRRQVQAPPDAAKRTFNEHDILGDFDRDEKGSVVVLQDEEGRLVDKQGRPVNERGYLLHPSTGDIIENQSQQKMFDRADVDERGEVPAPFCVEKFNFNPFDLRGNFPGGKQPLQGKAGAPVDKDGRLVNARGWLVDAEGNLVDAHGRKKFDRRQLEDGLDLPKLYNYGAKRFDVLDVCG